MNYPHGIGHATSTELDTAKVGQWNPIQSKHCALRNEMQFTDRIRTEKSLYDPYKAYGSSNCISPSLR